MSKEKIDKDFKCLLDAFPNNEVFIFGSTLRNLLFGKSIDQIYVFVQCAKKDKQEVYSFALEYFEKNNIDSQKYVIMLDTKLDLSNKIFSLDTLYCDLQSLLEGSPIIQSKHKGVEDIKKKVVRIINKHQERIDIKPEIILQTINLATEIGFNIEVNTLSLLFSKRHLVKNLTNLHLYNLLIDIFNKCLKPRKMVAFLNTLGISKEVFGDNLNETASLNHLNKTDDLEFISLCFSLFEEKELRKTLSIKLGISDGDLNYICNITKIVSDIENESELTARKILNICGKERSLSISRLVKSLGFKDLGKKIKEQKNSVITFSELAITREDIKASFKVEDHKINEMLDLAMNKVLEDPAINEKAKLLIMLNKILKTSS